jgi:hypothetical protein
MATHTLPPEVMTDLIELAIKVGGDLGQSQHLLELIRDDFCPTYIIPNLWVWEYEH